MIDIHCHLLPGIDDGPPDLDAALALARALVADGVSHVVCTPHVFPGRFENRRSTIGDECRRFQAALVALKIPLQLSWAGEVRLTSEVLLLLQRDELPFLGELDGGSRTMLLEMPDGQVPVGADRLAARMLAARITPIIVHPERNRAMMEKPERLRPFVDMGCLVQLTASSVTGHFGSKAQTAAEYFLEEEWVHAVASDAHNLGGRKPRMREAAAWLAERYGDKHANQLTRVGPAEITQGNERVNARGDAALAAPGASPSLPRAASAAAGSTSAVFPRRVA